MYQAVHYNEVLKAVQSAFGIANGDLPPHIWLAWRVQIKRLFDQGILIREIIAAIPEAGEKRKWPNGIRFWRRIHDVVLKNRREYRPVKIHRGMQSINSILNQNNQ